MLVSLSGVEGQKKSRRKPGFYNITQKDYLLASLIFAFLPVSSRK